MPIYYVDVKRHVDEKPFFDVDKICKKNNFEVNDIVQFALDKTIDIFTDRNYVYDRFFIELRRNLND